MKIIKKTKLCRILLYLVLLIFFTGCGLNDEIPEESPSATDQHTEEVMETEDAAPTEDIDSDYNTMEVSFIDVGQGDSALITCGGESMLIDGSLEEYGDKIKDYLRQKGITTLTYLVATHPHSDHIGGLPEIIESFDIEKIYMPKVEHNTRTFENMLDAISDKGLKITNPIPGDVLTLGDAIITIIGPVKDYPDNLNNYSIVLRIEHGDNSFLFTGDAEKEAEADLVDSGFVLESDVLKIGHHGSAGSSIESFIDEVSPMLGVISVGADNTYGHPTERVLKTLKNRNISVYRTDLSGTIIFTSDGTNIFEADGDIHKQIKAQGSNEAEYNEYIGNINSKVFHLITCSSLPAEKNRIIFNARAEAVNEGYSTCSRCNP